jgi:hypothetical protein
VRGVYVSGPIILKCESQQGREIDRRQRMSRVILRSWWSLIQSTSTHALSSAKMTQSKDGQKKYKHVNEKTRVTSSNSHRDELFSIKRAQLEYIIILI